MRKSTLIIIIIAFIAVIPIISLFGTKSSINGEINVTSIECTNTTDNNCIVSNENDTTIIKIPYNAPHNDNLLTVNMYQLQWRVYPSNASNKDVKFVYDTTNDKVKFNKDEQARETGLVMFYGQTILDVKIMATDGTKIYKQITLIVSDNVRV